MDERLPLGSLDATTLRMLLEKERTRTQELEQEVAHLQAALAQSSDGQARIRCLTLATRASQHASTIGSDNRKLRCRRDQSPPKADALLQGTCPLC
jgi:hypothetical protein